MTVLWPHEPEDHTAGGAVRLLQLLPTRGKPGPEFPWSSSCRCYIVAVWINIYIFLFDQFFAPIWDQMLRDEGWGEHSVGLKLGNVVY